MNNCQICDDDGLNCNYCGAAPVESSASPAGYVAVPIAELEKLEQARLAIYEHLQGHIGGHMLQNLTAQIWRVANTKKWD